MHSVKAQGEGEYSRLGMVSIMSTRGLSCSEVKALLFFHTLLTMLYIQHLYKIILHA